MMAASARQHLHRFKSKHKTKAQRGDIKNNTKKWQTPTPKYIHIPKENFCKNEREEF
jgi:hypothetical protein